MTSRQIDILRKITDEKIQKLKKGDELPPGVIKLVKCLYRHEAQTFRRR
jgi:DNA-directed RNA polymerase subunit beta